MEPNRANPGGTAGTVRQALIASLLTLLDSVPEPVVVTVLSIRGLPLQSFQLDPSPREPPPDRPGEHKCCRQIRRVIAEAGHRLLLREIMDEFAERGIEWSERTVQRHVGEMVEDGRLDRDDDASPPGYGFGG